MSANRFVGTFLMCMFDNRSGQLVLVSEDEHEAAELLGNHGRHGPLIRIGEFNIRYGVNLHSFHGNSKS